MPSEHMDRLTSQLNYIPSIIGSMGINIAEAQQMLNADYVKTLTEIVKLYNDNAPEDETADAGSAALLDVLKQLAPSRYRFTESTIEFRADLAESRDIAGGAGIGFGMAGFAVNASFSLSYGMDYRAAARISSVLEAIPPGREFGEKLMKGAQESDTSNLTLPDRSEADRAVWEQVGKFREAIGVEATEQPAEPE